MPDAQALGGHRSNSSEHQAKVELLRQQGLQSGNGAGTPSPARCTKAQVPQDVDGLLVQEFQSLEEMEAAATADTGGWCSESEDCDKDEIYGLQRWADIPIRHALRDPARLSRVPAKSLNEELQCLICLSMIRDCHAFKECLHRFCRGCIHRCAHICSVYLHGLMS